MRIALAAGAGVAVIAVLLVLSASGPRLSGTNYVAETGEVTTIEGSGRHCQPDQVVPAGTEGVRLLLGTFEQPSPWVRVEVEAEEREVTSGTRAPGAPGARLRIPLSEVEERVTGEVCVTVRAEDARRTVLFGEAGLVRLEWLRDEDESWLSLLPTLAERFGFGKANPFGALLLPLAVLLMLLAWGLAGRLMLRSDDS